MIRAQPQKTVSILRQYSVNDVIIRATVVDREMLNRCKPRSQPADARAMPQPHVTLLVFVEGGYNIVLKGHRAFGFDA